MRPKYASTHTSFISLFVLLLTVSHSFSRVAAQEMAGAPVHIDPPAGQFINDWLLCGPFPNPLPKGVTFYAHDETSLGFYRDYLKDTGGESGVMPRAGDTVRHPDGHEVTWRVYRGFGPKVNLDELLTPNDEVVAYAACLVRSSQPRDVIMAVSSNDGVRVWHNGTLVLDNNRPGEEEPDRDLIPITLRPGDNRFLVKVSEGRGRWNFQFRFQDRAEIEHRVERQLPYIIHPTVRYDKNIPHIRLGRQFRFSALPKEVSAELRIYDLAGENIVARMTGTLGQEVDLGDTIRELAPGEHLLEVACTSPLGQSLTARGALIVGSPPPVEPLIRRVETLRLTDTTTVAGRAWWDTRNAVLTFLREDRERGAELPFRRSGYARIVDRLEPALRRFESGISVPPRVYPAVREWLSASGEGFELQERLNVVDLSSEVCAADVGRLSSMLQSQYGTRLIVNEEKVLKSVIVIALGAQWEEVQRRWPGVASLDVPEEEGYLIDVNRGRIVVGGKTPAGLHNGLITLRQMFQFSKDLPAGSIRDWPQFPVRTAYFSAADSLTPAFKEKLLRFIDLKYNRLIMSSRAYWDMDDPARRAGLLTIVNFLRAHHVDFVPYVYLIASPWEQEGVWVQDEPVRFQGDTLSLPVPRILALESTRPVLASAPASSASRVVFEEGSDYVISREAPPLFRLLPGGRIGNGRVVYASFDYFDRGVHVFSKACPSEETVYERFRRAVEDVVDALHPRWISVGHDEIGVVNSDSRCRRRGLTDEDLVADQFTRAHHIIKAVDSKAEMMIWSDTVNPLHNALLKDLDRVAERLPRDIIICHWFYGYEYPSEIDLVKESIRFFRDRDFRVLGCPWDNMPNTMLWEAGLNTHARGSDRVLGVLHTEWRGRTKGIGATAAVGWQPHTWLTSPGGRR